MESYTRLPLQSTRSLQPNEKSYGMTELEALGVVWALKHYRPHLLGHIYTDHTTLRSLINTIHPSSKRAGALSRVPVVDLCPEPADEELETTQTDDTPQVATVTQCSPLQ